MTKILIVEDDPTQRLVASAVMKNAGYLTVEAVDGFNGLDMARLHRPDLILCDVQMPGMSGFEFVEALRGEADLAQTPVILLTALGQRAHVRIGMVSGADDYIGKPFRASELQEAVAAQLARRKSQQEQLDRQVASVKGVLAASLDQKIEILADQYEQRLAAEINQRWSQGGNGDAVQEQAVVLLVNLFDFILRQPSDDGMRTRTIRRLHERCRDTLYLFGAQRLVPYGNDLLAIFEVDERTDFQQLRAKAIRSAFALRKTFFEVIDPYLFEAVSRQVTMKGSPVSIALASGTLVLSKFTDPLHGDETSMLASGDVVTAVQLLKGWAKTSGWELICPPGMTVGLEALVSVGRASVIASDTSETPVDIVELLSLNT